MKIAERCDKNKVPKDSSAIRLTPRNKKSVQRKYHSGTICKGVSNPQTSNALSGCEKEDE